MMKQRDQPVGGVCSRSCSQVVSMVPDNPVGGHGTQADEMYVSVVERIVLGLPDATPPPRLPWAGEDLEVGRGRRVGIGQLRGIVVSNDREAGGGTGKWNHRRRRPWIGIRRRSRCCGRCPEEEEDEIRVASAGLLVECVANSQLPGTSGSSVAEDPEPHGLNRSRRRRGVEQVVAPEARMPAVPTA